MKVKVEVTRNSNGSVDLRPLRSDRKDSDFATEDAKIEISMLSEVALRSFVIEEQYEITIEPISKDASRSTRKSVTTLAAEQEAQGSNRQPVPSAPAAAATRTPATARTEPAGKKI